jgi:hypothetical protein
MHIGYAKTGFGARLPGLVFKRKLFSASKNSPWSYWPPIGGGEASHRDFLCRLYRLGVNSPWGSDLGLSSFRQQQVEKSRPVRFWSRDEEAQRE